MMGVGEFIDQLIEPFSPEAVARRISARVGLAQLRQYDVAMPGRRTQGWNRPSTNADSENYRALGVVRNSVRDLVRNNPPAASALHRYAADVVGSGISVHVEHRLNSVRRKAQDAFDRWAEEKNCGESDFFEHQKLTVRGVVESGETIGRWWPDEKGPDARLIGMEADYLDNQKTQPCEDGGKIVQGVQFDKDGNRTGYWLYPSHPGDVLFAPRAWSEKVDARDVDHTFERLRFGQTRGVSMLAPVAMALRDLQDTRDALRMKEKVQACIALILTPPDGQAASRLSSEGGQQDKGPGIETLRPGMIFRTQNGETANTLVPAQSSSGVEFIRQELMQVSACLVPYYALSGDASQSSYTAHRALLMAHYGRLDDFQSHVVEGHMLRPAFQRRMRRLAIETGDMRFLEVRARWSYPQRRAVDPVKDLMAEIMEIRSGLKTISMALRDRGIDADEHFAELKRINDLLDQHQLALDTDPRKLSDQGIAQPLTSVLGSVQSEAAKAA